MDYGSLFVDETAAPVENAFLEFLKRFDYLLSLYNLDLCLFILKYSLNVVVI